MKFDELFPRYTYPLRAKSIVHFPEHGKHIKISVYYQMPCELAEDQEAGYKQTFVANGKEIANVVLYIRNDSLLLLENGEWVERDENSPEVAAIDAAIEKNFGEDWLRVCRNIEKKWVSF